MAAIFLSYSRADRPKAQVFAEALTAEGFSVWWDKVLRAGQTYDEVTEGMLRDADVVVVLWSAVSVKSKWVRTEATLGQRTSVLVPAMIEDAERPIMFELTQSADLIGWEGDRSDVRWQEFVADIRRAAEQAAESEAKAALPPSPAPGQAADMTMELTFWTSVKDSDDQADFHAYLKRYPEGHYSDLARNRIAAIERAEARAAAPRPVAPAPPPPPAPSPPPPVASSRKPAPVAPKPAPAPARTAAAPARKPGSSLPLVLGGLAAIVLTGWIVSTLIPNGEAAATDMAETAAPTAPEAPALPEPEVIEIAATETGPPVIETPVEPEPEPEPAAPVCDVCPAMVSLPGGTFSMGSPATEAGREPIEGPLHDVTVKAFSISKTEITAGQWAACLADSGCGGYRPPAAESDGMPVTAISWRDANAYTKWLSTKDARTYRLPTEAEWEYAARGGTSTAFWWGDRFDASKAPRDRLREASSLPENTFGLQGMLGNVREWVEDCYVNGYSDAPADGSAVLSGDCGRRVVRGGSIKSGQAEHRAANRARISVTTRDRQIGFRVVREED